MLIIKIASNIFLTSTYICSPISALSPPASSLQEDISYVKVGV